MKSQKKEIIYHVINSCMAGSLVFLGSITSGNITMQGLGAAIVASLIVAFTKFKHYWTTQEKEYKYSLFNF